MVSVYTDNQKIALLRTSDDTAFPQSPPKIYGEMLDDFCTVSSCDDIDEILDCHDAESLLSEDRDGEDVDEMLLERIDSFREDNNWTLEVSDSIKPCASMPEGEPSDFLLNMYKDQALRSNVILDGLYADYPKIKKEFNQLAFLDLFDDNQSDLIPSIPWGDPFGADREHEPMPESQGWRIRDEDADEMLDDEHINIDRDNDRSDGWKLSEGAFDSVQAILDGQQEEMLI